MEIKSLASILLLFMANFCYSQANISVIRANSDKVAIRDYDKLTLLSDKNNKRVS
jgi:hypothetical protein